MKNRPLAEHIFEIFSKHLPENVLAQYSEELHNLMIDKLEGLGLPMNSLTDEESAKDALGKVKNLITSLNKDIEDKSEGNNYEVEAKNSSSNEAKDQKQSKQRDK